MEAKQAIFETLGELHAAQEAHDVEGMLRTYAVGQFVQEAQLRQVFERLVARGAFRGRTVDTGECETYVHGDHALVKPVR